MAERPPRDRSSNERSSRWRSLGAYGSMPADKDTTGFPMQLQQFIGGQDFSHCKEILQMLDEMLDVFVGRNCRAFT
jgi:hypothetical protein